MLEHVLSEELEELIAAKLGDPTHDPHGDPIPTRDLTIEEGATVSLQALEAGARGTFARVSDSDPEMLRFLADRGIAPGDRLRGGRQAAVRRTAVRPLRRRVARPRRRAGAGDAGRGQFVTPPRGAIREPAFEGATADGAPVVLGDGALGPSPLERLLARGRLRATLAMLGPAFVASVAYVDPGNFATNIQGGAKFGYLLLWVVLLANLMAMLIQYLSAKLGIVTDRSLPELCRERIPRWMSVGLWVQAELMAMATDIAEFLGAAIGLNLLFGVPLLTAGLITGVIAFAILELQARGYRRFELAITGLLGLVFAGFLYETLRIGPSAHESLRRPHPGPRAAPARCISRSGSSAPP